MTSCSLFKTKSVERGEELTSYSFPELKEGRVTWGELALYLEEVIIALGDSNSRLKRIDND